MCADDFAVGARQRKLLAMPFDDTTRHDVPHQHRSHHDISRLGVAQNANSPDAARRSADYIFTYLRPPLIDQNSM